MLTRMSTANFSDSINAFFLQPFTFFFPLHKVPKKNSIEVYGSQWLAHVMNVFLGIVAILPDHLCPSDGFLQLHQPLFILVPLHQDSGHLHSGETFPLGCGHVALQAQRNHETKPRARFNSFHDFDEQMLTSSSFSVLTFCLASSSLALTLKCGIHRC